MVNRTNRLTKSFTIEKPFPMEPNVPNVPRGRIMRLYELIRVGRLDQVKIRNKIEIGVALLLSSEMVHFK